MGTKGARGKAAGIEAAAALAETLSALGVTSKSMFGGHGLFKDGVMFAIVDSEGRLYLRADGSTAMAFESAGSTQHARMPYWEVPEPIREDADQLREWAATAAEVAARGRR
ncbi:MAG: TfoX/Sxy family protein [Candidatus Limnocylindrales bacterium]